LIFYEKMGEVKGFLKYKRQDAGLRPVEQRIHDFRELDLHLTPDQIRQQAARCMDCGIPFCHGVGCPLGNSIPDLNDFIYKGQWERACRLLHATNNFPEITGRVCPGPCETACTLSINDEPVTIRHIEYQIVEMGFSEGWIEPLPAVERTGRRVAIIGSGPAGLAAAQQLARAGHAVTVFEKDQQLGGILRYGIPDFKLEKRIIDRRLKQLIAEGVEFQTDVNVGNDISVHYLLKMSDCVLLAMGARQPRPLDVPGADLQNVVYAMDFLTAQNPPWRTKDKAAVVIGGGDTGSDCVGTARRQGAKEIYQLEILPKPPENRPVDTPWPMWPRIMRTSSSHEEGCHRRWSVMTKRLTGNKRVEQLHGCEVQWIKDSNGWKVNELSDNDFVIKTDLVILAMGFLHVVQEGLIANLDLQLDDQGNVAVNDCQASRPGIFAAGDIVNGPSLVVTAIKSGREAATAINRRLQRKI
jgi:glutamate synthase (NADPH/NADH) small chain